MKQKISLLLSLAVALLLCSCGNNDKEIFYQQFVSLVEGEQYKEAINFWLEEYDKQSTASYEDFKEEYFAYKDFQNYFNYATALESYIGAECKSLSSLKYLESVPSDFLDSDKYVTEIKGAIEAFQGIYEHKDEDSSVYRYIIVQDENVWFANGLSITELGTADIENHVIILENNLSVDEFCSTESSWDIYIKNGAYLAGNSLVKSESDCIFVFILDSNDNYGVGTQMTATATSNRYTMFDGSYTKIQ